MSSYQILCILCALALVTSVASSRLHKLQETVAITALALGMSLFLLLGLLLLLVTFKAPLWWFMLLAIPLVLTARAVSVFLPYIGFRLVKSYNPYAESILIWGGLRGGLALAMAMSLPEGVIIDSQSGVELRELVLVMTYAVVVFSILVQGSSMTGLIRRSNAVVADANRQIAPERT